MADRLDERLQPGERVLYQTQPNHASVWLVLVMFAVLAVGWGLFVWATDVTFDKVFWLFLVLFLIMLKLAFHYAWLSSGAALVTERRLLYDRGPVATLWSRQRVHDIPHREIAEIGGGGISDAFSLHLTDGRVLPLGNIAKQRRLAEALAEASGAPMSVA